MFCIRLVPIVTILCIVVVLVDKAVLVGAVTIKLLTARSRMLVWLYRLLTRTLGPVRQH